MILYGIHDYYKEWRVFEQITKMLDQITEVKTVYVVHANVMIKQSKKWIPIRGKEPVWLVQFRPITFSR